MVQLSLTYIVFEHPLCFVYFYLQVLISCRSGIKLRLVLPAKKITKQELQNAIEEVKSGVSLRKTAIKYNIDRTTLRRYTKNEQNLRKLDDKGSSYKASQIFTIAEEKLDRIFNKFVEL